MMKYIPLLLSALILTGCANAPTQVVIAPQVNMTTKNTFQNKTVNLQIRDVRSATHVMQIMKDERAVELISSQTAFAQIVEQQLNEGYKKQGLVISPNANLKIRVSIEKALINVDQQSFEYKASNVIVMKVEVSNAQGRLTRTFTKKGTSEGPLRADIAVLERDFNQQLASVLKQMINDHEVSQYIREKS